MKPKHILSVLLLGAPSVVLAESYITDTLNVGVYASDTLTGEPLIYIKSGDRVEVLESNGDKRMVLTESEEVGWVRATFITTREPLIKQLEKAKQDIVELESELEAEQKKHGSLAEKEKEATKSVGWMRAEMNKARKNAEELEAKLKALQKTQQAQAAEKKTELSDADQSELDVLQQEKDALEQQLAATLLINENEPPVESDSGFSWMPYVWPLITLLLGGALGAAICYRWFDRRLTERFGGIRFH